MEIYKVDTGFIFLKDKFLNNPNIPPDLKEIFINGFPINSYIIKYNNRQIIIDAGISPNSKYPLGRFMEKSFFKIKIKNNNGLVFLNFI